MLCRLLMSVQVALVAILAAVWLTTPVPPDLDHPNLARFSKIYIGFIMLVARSLVGLGWVEHEYSVVQWFVLSNTKMFMGPDHTDVQREETTMAGTTVILYHYMGADNPKKQGLAPAVVFIHGGGWVNMHTDYYHQPLQSLVAKTKLMVISVEYKMVPEALFPEPVHENARVVRWFLQNAAKFGNDPNKLVLMGDSAGGNLVASVCLLLRDDPVKPSAQVLIYPVLQAIHLALPSYQHGDRWSLVISADGIADAVLWYLFGSNKRYKEMMLANKALSCNTLKTHAHKISPDKLPKSYFPEHYQPKDIQCVKERSELDEKLVDPLFSPLLADDLSNAPAALVLTCEYDVLRDEGFLYAHRLREFGVKAEIKNYPDSFHSAHMFAPDKFNDDIAAYLSEVFR